MSRIKGLDTIRFICACWVVLSHVPHPESDAVRMSHFLRLLNGLFKIAFNGPAAVIVFFVISGFCIHYPYRNKAKIDLSEFYARRYIRIGVPFLVAVVLSVIARLQLAFLFETVLWSLVAEIIYYTIYPLLSRLNARFGWKRMIILSFVISYLVVLTNPTAKNYASYGWHLNWLVGLPCWMLGCFLAEEVGRLATTPGNAIWLWRSGVLIASVACLCLRFFSPIGYPLTLNVFGVLVYFWLRQEIPYFQVQTPAGYLEKAGQWSYSLYLTHMVVFGFMSIHPIQFLSRFLNIFITLPLAFTCAYIFYQLVEKPSHHLAKMFKKLPSHYSRSSV